MVQTLGSFAGFLGTMISWASRDVTRSIRTGPSTTCAAFSPSSLSFGVRGGIVMRSPSRSTDEKRRWRLSRPKIPPVTSKCRTSMNGDGFCCAFSRSFSPSPWMRSVGNES